MISKDKKKALKSQQSAPKNCQFGHNSIIFFYFKYTAIPHNLFAYIIKYPIYGQFRCLFSVQITAHNMRF